MNLVTEPQLKIASINEIYNSFTLKQSPPSLLHRRHANHLRNATKSEIAEVKQEPENMNTYNSKAGTS
ncbi:hypothetical protein E2C01_071598 [Portunus trituberculatus]|uniref:Uncharacterized protein n=1 Tax=Portunus trituberculatus TaxID=210409 RepID=A0A5B7HVS2_PORTR|nr:hypothetical protein [Portunus trituberculatus]